MTRIKVLEPEKKVTIEVSIDPSYPTSNQMPAELID